MATRERVEGRSESLNKTITEVLPSRRLFGLRGTTCMGSLPRGRVWRWGEPPPVDWVSSTGTPVPFAHNQPLLGFFLRLDSCGALSQATRKGRLWTCINVSPCSLVREL